MSTAAATNLPNTNEEGGLQPWQAQERNLTTIATLANDWVTALRTLSTTLGEWWQPRWRTIQLTFWAFTAGLVVASTALLVPLYLSVSQSPLLQPVTLFETILQDLDDAYVEPVDTQQLFETGIQAMLRSLDPYSEYEGPQEAVALTESIDGKYGGVGLVIAGVTPPNSKQATLSTPAPNTVPLDNNNINNPKSGNTIDAPLKEGDISSRNNPTTVGKVKETTVGFDLNDDDEDADFDGDEDDLYDDLQSRKKLDSLYQKAREKGVRVVAAFEGYAYDYGMRVGDKLLAVDDLSVEDLSLDQVRNRLRGEPGSWVTIQYERDGVEGIQTVTMPRQVVRLRDVKVATLLDNDIGYIRISGFSSDTGPQVRRAIQSLQQRVEDASYGERTLSGLILDLRGNPGGLLTSAVEVCSMLVPKGSEIVSAKGRGFPGVSYRSRVEPIVDPRTTRLAVLVNGQTASAAEIVSGAVQDLDVGVVIGSGRTFGKGLVQNVESLPYDSALKFTVAKYYTPSGRCIQGIKYKQEKMGQYIADKIPEEDRSVFYTKAGRVVRDGGGIEADYKVSAPKASALEVTLLRSGVLNEFAAEWSKTHELSNYLKNNRLEVVDEDAYRQFQAFCFDKQKKGELQLDELYSRPLAELKKTLQKSGYKGSAKSVEQLQARIIQDVKADFDTYRKDIKEDLSQSILARYLPESMLLERSLTGDVQVQAAMKVLQDGYQYDKLLARENGVGNTNTMIAGSFSMAASTSSTEGYRNKISF